MDSSSPWSLPSEEEFQKFFLYIGYDTISDRHQQQVVNTGEKPQHQQYRKFVQNNKDSPWARDLLNAVASVNKARNHYKTFIPMLMDRNMGALYRVCNDIVASNTPPHREIQYMERCYITGVWQDKNIDISKGGRGSNNTVLSSNSTTTSNATSPLPSPMPSPSPRGNLNNNHHHGESSNLSSPLAGCSLSSPTAATTPTNPPTPNPPLNPPPLLVTSSTLTSNGGGAGGGGIYISPRFKHFAQMLWTIAKLDVIIKNFACDWFNSQSDDSVALKSRQCITTKFGSESQEFSHKLHKIFTHAVTHVCKSLHGHIHVPMFGSFEREEPQKRLRYTVLSASSNGNGDDVDMEDVSQLKGGKTHTMDPILQSIIQRSQTPLPSCPSPILSSSKDSKCAWPNYHCPHTPPWQLFSSCMHTRDSNIALLWHTIRRPFKIPFNVDSMSHACVWESMDHHLSGCKLCGRVHRCDTDRCEEILEGEPGFHDLIEKKRMGMRCPTEQTEDGSIVCQITGICIRTCSYGLEYELVSRQGLSSNDVSATISGGATTGGANTSAKEPKQEKPRKKRKIVPETTDTPTPLKQNGVSPMDGVFRIKFSAMKNDFHEENLASWIKRLISMVVQDKNVLYSKYTDSCEKRDALLQSLFQGHSKEKPVCMLSIAAKLENRVKAMIQRDTSTHSVQSYRDPYECLKIWSDSDVDKLVLRVSPYIYRLMAVLKTIDCNKYKSNNIPWMMLGMLYMCTCGHNIGNVMVLPRVGELCTILPNDNRIFYYFGDLKINTKCVTEMSNMIAVSLKGNEGALRVLANV